MAVSLLSHVVISDLCLGKPALRSLPISATVADALTALKSSEDSFISVWDCTDHTHSSLSVNVVGHDQLSSYHCTCTCVGKVCMVDVICYLCKNENLLSPFVALKAPISEILPKIPGLVMHLEPSSSLLEAIDLILEGTQNLVVPIQTRISSYSRRKQLQKPTTISSTIHNGIEFCWLTQEDIIRFLLSSIGLFSPIPALSIDTLGIISTDILAIDYHSPAISALAAITRSLAEQTSVAVIDSEGTLIGEISPFTLTCCNETVAAAITTLSSGDLMAYIDCGGPPGGLKGMLEVYNNIQDSSLSSSEDEEVALSPPRSGRYNRSMSYSARLVRRAEAIVCHPKSSLVAVMIQAIAHRVNYVWVIEDDCSLVGIVTFCDMLKVFREHLETIG
ncbi:CBS domain-containing protein CBSX5-like [Fagus crenata]